MVALYTLCFVKQNCHYVLSWTDVTRCVMTIFLNVAGILLCHFSVHVVASLSHFQTQSCNQSDSFEITSKCFWKNENLGKVKKNNHK